MVLTNSQVEAISHITGNLQLVACAGSGKTEVIARHITNLLAQKEAAGGGLRPANIIAFTFTEKAAAELKQRVYDRCRDRNPELLGMAEMYVGTIHGFCLDLLRTEVPDFLKFDVLNEVQQSLFINRNSRRSGLAETQTLSGVSLARYKDTALYIRLLSILREDVIDENVLAGNTALDGLNAYKQLLHDKAYFDYSSIIEEAAQSLRKHEALRSRLSQRLRVVIVDEYQDVNPIQEKLVRELHCLGADVRVVGDDDQTIYQWRGSDARNILSFSSRYPNVDTVKLEENFRSSEGITDVARIAISKNGDRLDKEMRSAHAQIFEKGDIAALDFESPQEEANYIAKTCKSLLGTYVKTDNGRRAISWSDMAILIRIKASGDMLRQALRSADVPFVSVGMNTLFDAPEAEAARELFYFMAGEAEKTATIDAWDRAQLGMSRSVLAAALDDAEQTREKMRVEDEDVRFSVYNIQRQYIGFPERIGIREEKLLGSRGEIVFHNLAKFSQLISDFESIYFHSRPIQKYESFAGFLRHQAESAYEEALGNEEKFVAPDAVQILTIHRSKGLQWPVVFIPQLVKNRFPAARHGGRTPWHVIPKESVEFQERYLGSLEDERRLFYVAVTRSQKHLYMTYAPTADNKRLKKPSQFWYDVRESEYVKITVPDFASRAKGTPQPRQSIENVNLTFSDMKYFFECPYQFKMRTVYGFNAPLDEALGYGKSLHDALAEIHQRAIDGTLVQPEDAEELIDRHLRVPFAYPKLKDTMRDAGRKTLKEYIEARREEFENIEFSEKQIELQLEDGVSVSGRIDLVRRRDTNKIAIVDLKSSEDSQTPSLTDAQLHVYALGYRDLTGRDADFVETYELDRQVRRPRAVDEDLISEVRQRVLDTAAALRSNAFEPKPEKQKCARCDFVRMCSAGEQDDHPDKN